MKRKPQYLIIFEHIIQQIYTGKITIGDRLDSIKSMSEEYMVSKNTIKTVIKMLSEKGFIETKAGSRPVLIQSTSKQSIESDLLYEKILQISEIYKIFSLIFPSIAMYNIKRFTSKDFEELNEIIDCMEKNSSNYLVFKEQRLKYINKLISKTNNFLIHHFCEIIQHDVIISQLAYNFDNLDNCCIDFFRNKYIEQIRKTYLYGLDGNLIEFKKLLTYMYKACRESILKMVENRAPQSRDTSSFNSVTLEKCYLYDLIVSDVICQIFEGNIKIGDCLPSITSIINRYNVSLPTVRSAYNELNELGIAKTINGKGTYVTLFSEYDDDYINTEEGAKRLSLLLDAMEFVTITLEDVVLLLGNKMDLIAVDKIETHLRYLQNNCEECKVYPDFVLLCKIVDYTQIYVLQETFLHLKQYMIFGIYLERFAESFSNIFKESLQYLKKVISSLNVDMRVKLGIL
ncbi:GntR family transcriptional regulator [Clostridioides difficile]|uniref:GntR family transcriptional regulator n=1 Tax=Clostridioides difficile TaxID=1496 RepID=UPI003731173A